MNEKLITGGHTGIITRSEGNLFFVGFADPVDIDGDGALVLSRKQARALRDHLMWQFEDEGISEEDG